MRASFFTGRPTGGSRPGPSWPHPLFLAALLAGGLAPAACGPARDAARNVEVELSFEPEPQVGQTLCTVSISDAEGNPLDCVEVDVEGNMNHAGMVPVFAEARETAVGIYEAPLEFTMGGDWFFIVHAELADGRSVERVLDVPGVAVNRAARSSQPPKRPLDK